MMRGARPAVWALLACAALYLVGRSVSAGSPSRTAPTPPLDGGVHANTPDAGTVDVGTTSTPNAKTDAADGKSADAGPDHRSKWAVCGFVPDEIDDCAERMSRLSQCFAQLDSDVDKAANAADAAVAAVDQLTAMIASQPNQDAATRDAAPAPLDTSSLRRALTAAQTASDRAMSRLQRAQRRRNDLGVLMAGTCVPEDALELMTAAAIGAGSAHLWSLDLGWRHRLSPRLASEVVLGGVISSQGVFSPEKKSFKDAQALTLGIHLRHGRGPWGEFYWGPSLAFGKKTDGRDLLAVSAQLGYSLSPQRKKDSWLGSDFRLFLEPWFPSSGGAVMLFGFGLGGGAFF